MPIFLKKKKETQDVRNMDTAKRVREVLNTLKVPAGVVLALVPSSKEGKEPYKITMGPSGSVFCECDGFKYRSKCAHMDRFRAEMKPVVFKRR